MQAQAFAATMSLLTPTPPCSHPAPPPPFPCQVEFADVLIINKADVMAAQPPKVRPAPRQSRRVGASDAACFPKNQGREGSSKCFAMAVCTNPQLATQLTHPGGRPK
jgi:G3E family GTPase